MARLLVKTCQASLERDVKRHQHPPCILSVGCSSCNCYLPPDINPHVSYTIPLSHQQVLHQHTHTLCPVQRDSHTLFTSRAASLQLRPPLRASLARVPRLPSLDSTSRSSVHKYEVLRQTQHSPRGGVRSPPSDSGGSWAVDEQGTCHQRREARSRSTTPQAQEPLPRQTTQRYDMWMDWSGWDACRIDTDAFVLRCRYNPGTSGPSYADTKQL